MREWPVHWWEHVTLDLGRQVCPGNAHLGPGLLELLGQLFSCALRQPSCLMRSVHPPPTQAQLPVQASLAVHTNLRRTHSPPMRTCCQQRCSSHQMHQAHKVWQVNCGQGRQWLTRTCLQTTHSCGDLMFSSHTTFALVGCLTYNEYGSTIVTKAGAFAPCECRASPCGDTRCGWSASQKDQPCRFGPERPALRTQDGAQSLTHREGRDCCEL